MAECPGTDINDRGSNMAESSLKVRVRVLAVSMIQDFRGEALLAGIRPRFVVSLILEDMDSDYEDPESGASIKTHRVAVFAIDSVVKLFIDDKVVGESYTLNITTTVINGIKRHFLALA
jgi:hypothetical protein